MTTEIISFRHGDHSLGVAPDMGAVTHWRWRGHSIFRPTPPSAVAARDPLDVACFAMAPWVSRVRDSRFSFRGRDVRLTPESDPRLGNFAIHGEVWRAPWALITHDATRATIETRPRGAWPWPYVCRQSFDLSADGLRIALTLRSEAETAFPFTFGLHPYFARAAENRLTASVTTRAILSADGMPLGEEDGANRWRDDIVTRGIEDHCYHGWNGEAVISYPSEGFRVRMRATGCSFLQVYAPDTDYFCVEPQMGSPDALNRGPDSGVQVLEPGASATIAVCFTPEDI